MAAITSAAIIGTAGLVQAQRGQQAAKKASKAAQRGADAATEEQRRQFDESLRLTEQQRFVGNGATNALARMLGLPSFGPQQQAASNFDRGLDANGNSLTSLVGDTDLPIAGRTIVPRAGSKNTFDVLYNGQDVGDLVRGGSNGRFIAGGAPIPQLERPVAVDGSGEIPVSASNATGDAVAAFLETPDYQFRRGEGQRDIQNSFAARGGAQSGNALRALSEFNSNLASGEFNNRFNRLATLAGFGQAVNQQAANNAITTGRGVGASLTDAANARASGVAGSNQAFQEGLGTAVGTIPLFADAFEQRRQQNAMRRLGSLGDTPAMNFGTRVA